MAVSDDPKIALASYSCKLRNPTVGMHAIPGVDTAVGGLDSGVGSTKFRCFKINFEASAKIIISDRRVHLTQWKLWLG